MPEGDSSGDSHSRLRGSRWWRQLRQLISRTPEHSLRESLEEAIDEAEDAPANGKGGDTRTSPALPSSGISFRRSEAPSACSVKGRVCASSATVCSSR